MVTYRVNPCMVCLCGRDHVLVLASPHAPDAGDACLRGRTPVSAADRALSTRYHALGWELWWGLAAQMALPRSLRVGGKRRRAPGLWSYSRCVEGGVRRGEAQGVG